MVQDPSPENDPSQVKTKSYHTDPRSRGKESEPEEQDDRCLDVCGQFLEEEGVDAAEAALKRDGLDACVETCVQDQVLGYHEIKLGNSFVPFEYDLTPKGFRSSNGQYLSEILENSNGLEREYIENLLDIERKILSGETTQAFLVSREPGSNTPVVYSYTVDPENKNKIRANTIIMWGGEAELANYLGALSKQTGLNATELYNGSVVTQSGDKQISDQDMFQAGYEALSQNATVKVQGGDPFRDQIAQQKETVATLRGAYKQYLESAGSEQEQLERVRKLATLHPDAVSEVMKILNLDSKELPEGFDNADMLDRITLLVEGLQDTRHSGVDKVETAKVESGFSERVSSATSSFATTSRSAYGNAAPRSATARVASPVGAFSKGLSEPVRGGAPNPVSSQAATARQSTIGHSGDRNLHVDGSRRAMTSPGGKTADGGALLRPSKPRPLRGRERFSTDGVVPRGQRVPVKSDIPVEEKPRENRLDKELKRRLLRDVEVPQSENQRESNADALLREERDRSGLVEEPTQLDTPQMRKVEGNEPLVTEGANDLIEEPLDNVQSISEELELSDDIEQADQVTSNSAELEDERDLVLDEERDGELHVEATTSEEQPEQIQDISAVESVTVDSGSIDFEQSDELAEIESLFEDELRIEEEEPLVNPEVEQEDIDEADGIEEVLLDDGVESSENFVASEAGLEEDLVLDTDAEPEELVERNDSESAHPEIAEDVTEEDMIAEDATAEDMVEAPTVADEIAFLESLEEGAYSDEIVFEPEGDLENADQHEELLAEQGEESIPQAFEESIVEEEEVSVGSRSDEEALELEPQTAELDLVEPLDDESEVAAQPSRLADQVEEIPPSIQHREARIRLLRQLHELALEQELELEEFMKKHRRYKKRELELDFLIYRLLFELEISDEFREYLMQEVGFSDLELEQLLELLLQDQEHLSLSSELVQKFRSFRLRKRTQKHEPLFDKALMQ